MKNKGVKLIEEIGVLQEMCQLKTKTELSSICYSIQPALFCITCNVKIYLGSFYRIYCTKVPDNQAILSHTFIGSCN